MNKIKKTLLTLTLILSALSLSACDEINKPEDKPAIEDTETEKPEDDQEEEKEDSEQDDPVDEVEDEDQDSEDETSEPDEDNKDEEDSEIEKDDEDTTSVENSQDENSSANKSSFNSAKTKEYKDEIISIGGPDLFIIQDDNSGVKKADFSKIEAVAKFENKDLKGWVIRYDNSKIGIATHHKKAVDPIVNLWSQESLISMSEGQFTGMRNDEASEYKEVSLSLIETIYKEYENKVNFAY